MLTRGNSPSALSSESQLMSLKINTRHATPIRENPVHEKKEKKTYEKKRRFTAKRLTYEQRKAKVAAAKKEWLRKIAAGEIQPKA